MPEIARAPQQSLGDGARSGRRGGLENASAARDPERSEHIDKDLRSRRLAERDREALLVEPSQLDRSPRIVALSQGHVMLAPGDYAYVRGDVGHTVADLSRAAEYLDFTAQVGLRQGLTAEIEWLRERSGRAD
jgi:hypothetical protein